MRGNTRLMRDGVLHSATKSSALGVIVAVALAACVGDETGGAPQAVADAGAADSAVGAPSDAGGDVVSSDGGLDASDATTPLPRIDEYSVSTTTWSGTKTECVNKADAAIKALGGGYALAAGGSSSVRYANRAGAVLVATCSDDAAKIVTQAWAMKTAADATNDEARLRNLVFDMAPPAVSPVAAGLPMVRAAQRVRKVAGLALSTCQNRAKTAIDAAMAKAPASTNKWSKLGGTFMAAGGTDGSTGSITCLGDASGTVVVDVFTIDPAVTTDALIEILDSAFTASG